MCEEDGGGAVRQTVRFVKGCNPLVQTGRSRLQNERACLNQQITRQMRMRAGAENLFRATTNSKVRDMVLLELSYVNSNLQLLMEQLEALNTSLEVYQSIQKSSNTPLIAMGLKETKQIDFSGPLKTIIQEHYGEDGSNFEDEICDLMDMRQACRNPSRSEAGVELLSSYFSHLNLLESRFFPAHHTTVFFTWYDAFTGIPVCQPNICLEKASVLFNMGALYTQIGARCDRKSHDGLQKAIAAFQKAAGVLSYLKEMFSYTPSYDMSSPVQSTLIHLTLAQAQECLLEKEALSTVCNNFLSVLHMAQEAAKVSESYEKVHLSMIQLPVKEPTLGFWSTMAQVKSTHYRALSHYFVAVLLIDHKGSPGDDVTKQENALLQLYVAMPDGCPPQSLLVDQEMRRSVGRAHLRRALEGHKEAVQLCSLCHHLQQLDTLLNILQACQKRSAEKLFCSGSDSDLAYYGDVPEVIAKANQEAKVEQLILTNLEVKDLFHKLGPLSVFSARHRWTAPRKVKLFPTSQGLGFTLKGDGPVQVHALDPVSPASVSAVGLQDGDYVVAVGTEDCRWMGASAVLALLEKALEDGGEIQVISMMNDSASVVSSGKSATYCGSRPKTYSMICLTFNYDEKIAELGKDSKKTSFFSCALKTKMKSSSLPSMHYLRSMGKRGPTVSSLNRRMDVSHSFL
ncbi:rhophilin-2-like isoform X2 [Arapaima gigas]